MYVPSGAVRWCKSSFEFANVRSQKTTNHSGIEWSKLAAAALFTLFPCHAHLSHAEIYGWQCLICAGGRPPNRCIGLTGGRTSLHAPKVNLCVCAAGKFGIWPSLLHSGPRRNLWLQMSDAKWWIESSTWWLDVRALCERIRSNDATKLNKDIPLWAFSKNCNPFLILTSVFYRLK